MDCWEKGVNVQQEVKSVDLLDCCLLHPQVLNQQVMLFANVILVINVHLKVKRHPGLQKARQMSIFKNPLIVEWISLLFK